MKDLLDKFWGHLIGLLVAVAAAIAIPALLALTLIVGNACIESNSIFIFTVPFIFIFGLSIILTALDVFIDWYIWRYR